MVRANMKRLGLLACLMMLSPAAAIAAEVTEVLDAADTVVYEGKQIKDVIDVALTASFAQSREQAKLKYEDIDDTGRLALRNDLTYEKIVNKMDIGLEIGMYHDLAFRMNVPVILGATTTYKYDSYKLETTDSSGNTKTEKLKVDGKTSRLASDGTAKYKFKVLELRDGKLEGAKRAGLGDMSFGIAWSPMNLERSYDPSRPWFSDVGRSTLTLAFDYTAPISKVMTADNTAVGRGLHEFKFTVAGSKRFKYLDPYFRLTYVLPLNSSKSGFKDYAPSQKRLAPGMWGQLDLGMEIVPWESLKLDYQRYVKFDLRAYLRYVSEGREYSELLDGIGKSGCNGADNKKPECAWVYNKWGNSGEKDYEKHAEELRNLTPANLDAVKSLTFHAKEDGIFDYEGYGVMGAMVNLRVMPVQYVEIFGGASFEYAQDHFITFAKVGRDKNKYVEGGADIKGTKDGVVLINDPEERSPTYNPDFDAVGKRIRKTENFKLDWMVGLKVSY